MEREHSWRFIIITSLLSLLPLFIILQLIRIQVVPDQLEVIRSMAADKDGYIKMVQPARGQVFDRWGNMLAGNQMVYEVGVELKDVKNPRAIAMVSSMVLGVNYNDVFVGASLPASEEHIYFTIRDNVSQEKVQELELWKDRLAAEAQVSKEDDPPVLNGMVFTPKLGRAFPENTLGSNLLGFVNQENQGFYGIEGKFNDLLAGQAKAVYIPMDPNRVTELPDDADSASLVLTVDREIQAAMEQLVDESVESSGADSGTIVVVDPRNGEILAMATTPRLNPNEYWRFGEVFPGETPFNRAISQAYEPGSIFKILTVASALDNGNIQPSSKFLDTGTFEYGGIYITNWNRGAWGPVDIEDCLRYSLNTCLAWIATKMGPVDYYRYMQAFGLGRSTGIELAGEVPGRLKMPGDGDWYDGDLATNAFGQGVAVTPLQMVMAASAIANDGRMFAPRIVRSMINKGYQSDIEPRLASVPITPETAHTLSGMLTRSLEQESSNALVDGYRVAGKTGTAEIPTPTGYDSNQTNASFIGWGPLPGPRFVVLVWLERPSSSIWGSEVAAPVFRQAVEKLVVLMDIPPDDVREALYGR